VYTTGDSHVCQVTARHQQKTNNNYNYNNIFFQTLGILDSMIPRVKNNNSNTEEGPGENRVMFTVDAADAVSVTT